jgi:hypothetical protein
MEFLDAGSVGYSNPTEIALAEAREIWPGRKIDVLLSLGTGSQKVVDAGRFSELAQINQRLLENCEAVHDRVFRTLHTRSYFRFSVDRGLEGVGVEEWIETPRLAGITSGYLRTARPSHDLCACVEAIESRTEGLIIGA